MNKGDRTMDGMADIDGLFDMILGMAFWIALAIPACMFAIAALRRFAQRLQERTPGGGTVSGVDGALMDRVFSLGQNGTARRIGDATEARATLGLRLGVPAAVALAGWLYYTSIEDARILELELSVYAFSVYYVAFIFAYSLRYDTETLWVRGWLFTLRRYDLSQLDGITSGRNGTYRLWFTDGRKIDVLRHITGSESFYRAMRAVIARNQGLVPQQGGLRNRLI